MGATLLVKPGLCQKLAEITISPQLFHMAENILRPPKISAMYFGHLGTVESRNLDAFKKATSGTGDSATEKYRYGPKFAIRLKGAAWGL